MTAFTMPSGDQPMDVRACCSDPQTPPEVLAELEADSGFDERVDRSALAANPSTPLSTQLKLTRDCAALVTRNPAFRLRMAMGTDFLWGLRRKYQVNIGRAAGVESQVLCSLGQGRSRPVKVREAVARNPDCPVDLMGEFLRHAWPVRKALARNPSLPDDLLPALVADERPDTRITLASRERLPVQIVELLAADGQAAVRQMVAQRRDLPMKVLRGMAGREWEPGVLMALIYNPKTPGDVMARFCSHHSESVQAALRARRPDALESSAPMVEPVGPLRFSLIRNFRTHQREQLPDWVTGALIDYGWTRSPYLKIRLAGFSSINGTTRAAWPPVREQLSEEELFALLRGLIFMEADTDGSWHFGSVSSTIWLARVMIRTYPHRGDHLRAFVGQHSINGHMWGLEKTQAERTPEERVAYIRAELARKDAHEAEQRRREAQKAALVEARAAEVRRRAELQRARSEERAREHETLSHCAPADRLRRIIENTRVTLAYFSPEWGEVSHAVLSELRPDELTALHVRCQLKSSRSWRRVAARCQAFVQATTETAVPELPQDARQAPDDDAEGEA